MELPHANRKYNAEEKRQLVANLDIEVAHRTRQFEAWLTDRLENFTIHQEGQVSRIPRQVRGMTMREFGEKYQGNIQAALRGFQREKLAAAGSDSSIAEIDKSMRKRKWMANQEVEGDSSGNAAEAKEDLPKASKSAKISNLSPKKVPGSSTGPGTTQRARLISTTNKVSAQSRTLPRISASPSPTKSKPPFNPSGRNPRIPPSRPTSPVKTTISKTHNRVPSTPSFNPDIPSSKAPGYPSMPGPIPTLRLPRRDESMLSLNGSPLANPYEFGLGWFKGVDMSDAEDSSNNPESQDSQSGTLHTLKRTKSSIVIRRDPSVAFAGTQSALHSRTTSQSSFYTASQATSSTHSRENSQSTQIFATPTQQISSFRFPSSRPYLQANGVSTLQEATPRPTQTRSVSALVAIPMKDGHLLELDPLQASPGSLDALEGITDSAKKHAKMEMGRLVQAAVDKWKIR